MTRAVRVVDLITNLDMVGFQNHGGLAIILNRLEVSLESTGEDAQKRENVENVLGEKNKACRFLYVWYFAFDDLLLF